MDDDLKHDLQTDAMMQGRAVALRHVGKMRKVSEGELLTLCIAAEIGIMSVFASLDGETGEKAQGELDAFIGRVRSTFSEQGQGVDGMDRILTSATALLRSNRFIRYLC